MPLTKLNSASVIERLPVGSVLQTKTARVTASEDWTAINVMIGPTATITLSSTSNKILILVQAVFSYSSTSVTGSIGLRYATGTSVANTDTLVGGGDSAGSRSRAIGWSGQVSASWQGTNIGYNTIHDPQTTSQISYRLCAMSDDSSGTSFLGRTGRDNDNSHHPRMDTNITLMEIKG